MGMIIDDDGIMHKVFTNADMVAMLEELHTEIEGMKMQSLTVKKIWNNAIDVCLDRIQQKIDKLRGEESG